MPASHKRPLKPTVYTGTFLHTPALCQLEVLQNAAIGVDEHGVIAFIHKDLHSENLSSDEKVLSSVQSLGWGEQCKDEEGIAARSHPSWRCVEGNRDATEWFFPGFIGTSISGSATHITMLFYFSQ